MAGPYNTYTQTGQLDSVTHRVLRNTYWLLVYP